MFTGVQRCTVSWLVVNKVFYDCVSQLFKCVGVCVCMHICASLSVFYFSTKSKFEKKSQSCTIQTHKTLFVKHQQHTNLIRNAPPNTKKLFHKAPSADNFVHNP